LALPQTSRAAARRAFESGDLDAAQNKKRNKEALVQRLSGVRKMPMMTADQYEASLRKMKFEVYLQGELVANPVDHPVIRPSMNSVKATYALAQDPQYEDLMTATSHLTGRKINRFCHIHQSVEDLVKKVKMQRLMGRTTASCFQRCVGLDAINALDSTTFEMDAALGVKYRERFLKFLLAAQEGDWTIDGAMTDVKGDRGLAPSKQADPDMFLRVVERRDDGIVVRGAKAHQTGCINSHWIVVMPTQSMTAEDADYAVCFATPADARGIFYIYGRQSCDTRKLEGGDIDVGNKQFGGHEALMVFDDVFVPWDKVFMCGEHQFAGMLVERFAGYHRQSYGGCKVGVGDVLIGAAALAADYNGAAKASHVKDKLIEMTHLNETLYACGISCSCEGRKTASGGYLIDLLLANVCKQNVTRFPYEIARLAEDIAGGLMVTMPSEKDLRNPEVGKVVDKYLRGVASVPTEHRMRVMRLIENITLGTAAVGYRTESMHGAGSPQAQRIMIARQGNLAEKKELAKAIAGIPAAEKLAVGAKETARAK
jgi:4-hydroxybutyryl-CoA dehydratase/vinylacetyl-CoA-Delta-isomerase